MIKNQTNHKPQLNYVVQGSGQPVILIHGIAASLNDWQFLMPELTASGFRAFAMDLLGHGDSPKPQDPDAYQFDSIFRHLAAWMANLELDQPAVLIGHSLGGYFSLQYALNHPEKVRGLILVDPYFHPGQLSPFLRAINGKPGWAHKIMGWIPHWLVKTFLTSELKPMNEYTPQVRQQMAEDYRKVSPNVIHITHTIRDLNSELGRIEHPTLVIWGDNDITLDPNSFPELVKRLPNAQGYQVGCGHQPHLAKPDVFNAVVLDFLGGLGFKHKDSK